MPPPRSSTSRRPEAGTEATGGGVDPGLTALLVQRLGVARADVRADALLAEDLGLDSLALTELAMTLEDEAGVLLPEEVLARVATVGDLAAVLDAADAA